MKRKPILLTIAGLAAGLSLLVLAGCFNTPQATDQIQNKSQEAYQQDISNTHLAQHDSTHKISSLEAREIAVDFVGYGVAHDVQAFTEQDTLIFEVDVRNDAVRYVVRLNAESGNVKSLHRHENEYNPQTTDEPTQPTVNPTDSERENRTSSHAMSHHTISLDRAIEIANADLKSRGINATYRSNSGIDREKGQRVWELLFTTTGEHMPLIEYYINADNGNIVKFEWDD